MRVPNTKKRMASSMSQGPKAAFLIFTSGKIVCTGAKNIEDIRRVIITLAETLKSIGIENIYSEPEIIVQNIVATADFKVDLNLNAVVLGMGMENVEYEPEQFPGVVCRVKKPKVVVLVFSSGKLVVTGGKTVNDCEEGVQVIRKGARETWDCCIIRIGATDSRGIAIF